MISNFLLLHNIPEGPMESIRRFSHTHITEENIQKISQKKNNFSKQNENDWKHKFHNLGNEVSSVNIRSTRRLMFEVRVYKVYNFFNNAKGLDNLR